ncbi:MAG: hypothetical protein MJ120_05065 [Clostridia bacterium]|nr:hypothetical protein [Clostridia bacterium]
MDNSRYKVIEYRIFLSVVFQSNSNKTYYYETYDDSIEPNDFVVVPAGKANDEALVRVVKKMHLPLWEYPMKKELIKKVIRKADRTWEKEKNIEKKMLTFFDRQVEIIDSNGKIFDGLVVCVVRESDSKSGLPEVCIESKGRYLTFTSEDINSIYEITPSIIFGKLNSRKVYCKFLKKQVNERVCINIANADAEDEFVPFDVEEAHKICKRCSHCTVM